MLFGQDRVCILVVNKYSDGAGRHRKPGHLGRTMLTARIPKTSHTGQPGWDGGSPQIAHSVWMAPAGAVHAPAFAECELPAWALERIAAQFAPNGARFGVCHGPGPARTGLDPTPTAWAPEWLSGAELYGSNETPPTLDLALVIADPCEFEPEVTWDIAGPFWRTFGQAVRPGGLLLVHTHQHHDRAGLIDPAGRLVADATRAGLGYLQHHVLIHTRLLGEPLGAADPAPRHAPEIGGRRPVHRRVHTDFLAFTAH